MTTYGDNVYSNGGVLLGPASGVSPFGGQWFVDNSQSAGGDGKGIGDRSFITIATAVAAASAGDTIHVRGTSTDYDESVVCALDRISFIGHGFGVESGGWTADTDATILTLTGSVGALVTGFLFRPDGATSGCAIDISESVANDTDSVKIYNNVFKSTGTDTRQHILAEGSPGYVKIYNNHFTWCDTALNVTHAGFAVATGWEIVKNYFSDKCANYGIYVPLRRSLVEGNTFSTITVACSTLGYAAIGSYNDVHGNYFQAGGTWNTIGEATATDNWGGNYHNFALDAANPT